MRIGIVTHSLQWNYGGILQNFALQQVLKRLGHDPITIDFIAKYTVYRYLRSFCKTLILWVIPLKRRPFLSYKTLSYRNRIVDAFCRKYLVLTKRVFHYDTNVVSRYGIESVIVGSDQVWRAQYCSYPGHLEDMFLQFVQDPKIKKMAYAVSFGIDEWDYSIEQTEHCRELIKQFGALSVREDSGIDLCRKYLHANAVKVLDPTMLLSREDYVKVCIDVPCNTSRFVAAYILDMSLTKRRYIDNLAAKNGLSVIYFSAQHNMTLSIEEWLAMFRDAEYVVTDSFHGTVFSIIFNKPFVVLGNTDRGLARFYSLLNMFDLQDRMCCLDKECKIDDKIEWHKVNAKLKEWRIRSLNFLELLN